MPNKESQSLLEKAKSAAREKRTSVPVSSELVELIYAYGRDEVSAKQVADALGRKSSTEAYTIISKTFQHMILNGLLVPEDWLKDEYVHTSS